MKKVLTVHILGLIAGHLSKVTVSSSALIPPTANIILYGSTLPLTLSKYINFIVGFPSF